VEERGLLHIRKLSHLGVHKRKFCFRCPTQKVISKTPPLPTLSSNYLHKHSSDQQRRTEREEGLEKI